MGRLNFKMFSKIELKREYEQIGGDEDERAYNSDILVQRYWQRKRVQKILDKSNLIPDEKVLDIGCGSGIISNECARKGAIVYGFDLSSGAVKYAKAKEIKGTMFVIADAQNIPFKSDYFDAVVCSEVIEHLPEPEKMIAEITRVLKNQGRLFLFTPNSRSLWPIIEFFWDRFGRGRNYGEMHLVIFNKKELGRILKNYSIDHFESPFVLSPYLALLNSEKLLNFFERFEEKLKNLGIGAEIYVCCTLKNTKKKGL